MKDLMYLQYGLSSVYHVVAYQWYHLCSCASLMRAKYSRDVLVTEEMPFIPNEDEGHSMSMNPRGN